MKFFLGEFWNNIEEDWGRFSIQQHRPTKDLWKEVMKLNAGSVDLDETISNVGREGFKDVIYRFHNIPRFQKSKINFIPLNTENIFSLR